jgi:ribosomal protein S18 acetylase RimI-like enzyme
MSIENDRKSKVVIRPVTAQDKASVIAVEAKSTPNLRYVPDVFEMFTTDAHGEFFLAELDQHAVACAKFTTLPDHTAWLETLRVVPEFQGLGIGKKLYERYFEIAKKENVNIMRMYTGLNNAVSKGLAQYFGFELEETFLGYTWSCKPNHATATAPSFLQVNDADRVVGLLLPHTEPWGEFLVMNRTFYKITPDLCVYLAQHGCVYSDTQNNLVVLGARFSPHQALHLGMFAGDAHACIAFAQAKAVNDGANQLHCLFPNSSGEIENVLTQFDFAANPSPYIVMKKEIKP